MKTKVSASTRVFDIPDIVYHVYQRSKDGGLLFYSATDFLVFYTTYSFYARKHNIQVLALCLMHDHIHAVVIANDVSRLSNFVKDYTSSYSRAFNKVSGRKGILFDSSFGRARKCGGKRIRTTLAYVYNNPVERALCQRAEQYQWNFLAYAASPYPFSDPLVRRKASFPLKKSLIMISQAAKDNQPLGHELLHGLFGQLNNLQRRQLIDEIIRIWSFIDYDTLKIYYGSYEKMLLAFASNTGSEYDIKETYLPGSDRCYNRMSAFLLKRRMIKYPTDLITADVEKKLSLAKLLLNETGATPLQISKYLHFKIKNT